MPYLYGLVTGAAIVVLAWLLRLHSRHHMGIMRAVEDHEERLREVERVAESAAAGVDQLTADLSDLDRRALAVPPDLVYGVEAEGDDEAPAG